MAVLGVDIGGTKSLAALVEGARVLDRVEVATEREAGPQVWLDRIGQLVRSWSDRVDRAGITVSGLVREGVWTAANPATLNVPGPFPLAAAAQATLGVPVRLCNDAQAAAWGEFRHGAGAGRDLVYLTVSTGIGGGIVSGGRLVSGRSGLAGHVGQLLSLPDTDGPDRFEDCASGRWIAQEAGLSDARAAFAAAVADPGSAAARAIRTSAARVARLCRNLQLLVDPEVIVIGGGVGLAPGYLAEVEAALGTAATPAFLPDLVPAALGADAGVIGIAALADQDDPTERGPTT